MSKQLNLMDFLSTGEDNAITARELSRLLKMSLRDVTVTVNALRKSGEIICSSGEGFYLPADDTDVKNFVRNMESRIADMRRATKSAKEHLKKVGA